MKHSDSTNRDQTDQHQKEQEWKRTMLSRILSNEARDRLARLGLVKPEKEQRIENMLVDMATRGQIQTRITEANLIRILESVNTAAHEQPAPVIFNRRADEEDLALDEMINNL